MPKVFVFGEAKCGKTKLVEKLANPNNSFDDSYKPTIGVDYAGTHINSRHFKFWDTSGRNLFEEINFSFLKDSDIAVYCVDISKPLNKEKIDADIEKFKDYKSKMDKKIPIILVFTKTDLEKQVSIAEQDELINRKYGFISLQIHVSTKNSKNTSELSELLCELLPVTNQSTPLTKHSMFENSQQAKPSPNEDVSCEIPFWVYILCVPGWPIFLLYHLVNFLADTCATCSDVGEESVERKLQF